MLMHSFRHWLNWIRLPGRSEFLEWLYFFFLWSECLNSCNPFLPVPHRLTLRALLHSNEMKIENFVQVQNFIWHPLAGPGRGPPLAAAAAGSIRTSVNIIIRRKWNENIFPLRLISKYKVIIIYIMCIYIYHHYDVLLKSPLCLFKICAYSSCASSNLLWFLFIYIYTNMPNISLQDTFAAIDITLLLVLDWIELLCCMSIGRPLRFFFLYASLIALIITQNTQFLNIIQIISYINGLLSLVEQTTTVDASDIDFIAAHAMHIKRAWMDGSPSNELSLTPTTIIVISFLCISLSLFSACFLQSQRRFWRKKTAGPSSLGRQELSRELITIISTLIGSFVIIISEPLLFSTRKSNQNGAKEEKYLLSTLMTVWWRRNAASDNKKKPPLDCLYSDVFGCLSKHNHSQSDCNYFIRAPTTAEKKMKKMKTKCGRSNNDIMIMRIKREEVHLDY